MRMRKMLVAAATIAMVGMVHTAPAQAAVPACATYSTSAPRRVAQTGPDLVKASFAIANYCDRAYVVQLALGVWTCTYFAEGGYYCRYEAIGYSQNAAPAFSENGFEVTADCLDGQNRYIMEWVMTDGSTGAEVGHGTTNTADLDCHNDVPAGPGVQCPKYIYNLCRNIS